MACKPVIGIDLDGTVLDCRPRQQAVTCRLVPEVLPHTNALWMLKRDGFSTRAALKKLGLKVPEDFEQRWLELIEHPEYLGLDNQISSSLSASSFRSTP